MNTALHRAIIQGRFVDTGHQQVYGRESHDLAVYMDGCKGGCKQATIIWLILLFLGIVLGIDGYVLYHLRFENIFWTLCTAVFFVTGAAYAIVLMYIFPLLARFDNTVIDSPLIQRF